MRAPLGGDHLAARLPRQPRADAGNEHKVRLGAARQRLDPVDLQPEVVPTNVDMI